MYVRKTKSTSGLTSIVLIHPYLYFLEFLATIVFGIVDIANVKNEILWKVLYDFLDYPVLTGVQSTA
jgi:hypothetical protein